MFKLFHKKLNKKGFTLAELLVVVAIIAILIAIAIPIFTNALENAQLRTNQANIRAVKAAAVTEILANWDKHDSRPAPKREEISTGVQYGWTAFANVDAKGNIANISIMVAHSDWGCSDAKTNGIVKAPGSVPTNVTTPVDFSQNPTKAVKAAATNDDILKTIKPPYTVQVYLKDVKANVS